MTTLSVVTLTLNEADHIEDFLTSHAFADEILVIDSGSTDGTVEKARAEGATVRTREWPGFAAQWNWAFHQCSGEWILWGDADHVATPAFERAILLSIQRADVVGFLVPRLNFYQGKPLWHGGWYPDVKVRLFKRGFARFDTTRSVHEQIRVSGPCGRLTVPVHHYTYRDLGEAIDKLNRYTSLEALDRARYGPSNLWRAGQGLGLRERIGMVRSALPFGSAGMFFYRFIVRLGFLDGREGWEMAVVSAVYEFATRAKLRELRKKQEAAKLQAGPTPT